jgi:hypothetical protein
MFSRKKPPPLTLEQQRKLASGLTSDERKKEREEKYGSNAETLRKLANCVGEGCLKLGDKANDAMVALNPLLEEGSEKLTECMGYTGEKYKKCAASVKETAQNAAEVARDTARNMAVRTQEAMIRELPDSYQGIINASRRDSDARQKFDKSQEELDKQFPEFQLFVTTTGRTYTFFVHGYYDILDIKTLLQNKEVFNFNSFLFNGQTYNVEQNLRRTLSELNINSNNQTITIMSGGMKKTKKRRKSTTTKRRKMVRRRKGTKRRV